MSRDWKGVDEEYIKLADDFGNTMWFANNPRERLEMALRWIAERKGEELDVIQRYFDEQGIEVSENFMEFEERGDDGEGEGDEEF